VFGVHNGARLEPDRKTYIGRKLLLVSAAEGEPRSRQEHASPLKPHASAAMRDIESPRQDERDGPAGRDFLLGVIVRLVRRMVEAAHRKVWGRAQELVTVHRFF
jgi:hypothetical protein